MDMNHLRNNYRMATIDEVRAERCLGDCGPPDEELAQALQLMYGAVSLCEQIPQHMVPRHFASPRFLITPHAFCEPSA